MTDHSQVDADLIDDGLLWYINRVAFHPRGMALAYDPDTQEFFVWGDLDEPWTFDEESDKEKFVAFEHLLSRLAAQIGLDGK